MSWKEAQEEAQRWLDKARLAELLKQGEPVDLRPYASLLPTGEHFRAMVLNSAKIKLKKKHVTAYFPGE